MTSERRVLLAGTIDAATGRVDASPVIACIDESGRVASWQPMGTHEPHSTVFMSLLLELPSLRLVKSSGSAR